MSEGLSIGERVHQFRVGKGISQREFAKVVGFSPSAVSLIESGKREATITFLRSASEALGIPIQRFFDDDDITATGRIEGLEERLEVLETFVARVSIGLAIALKGAAPNTPDCSC